jgi:short-subunit dehydrogenase
VSRAKLILLTGASSGIGRAAALRFAARGDRLLALARTSEALEQLAAECDGILPIVADVADAASMQSATRRILIEHGLPDAIVANAGIGLDALFHETTDEALHRLLEVNVVGVFRSVRPFVEPMLERGSGRIVIVSSIVGKRGVPHYAGYSASKFALHGAADALRAELWGSGVTVGLLCPSSTETSFRANGLRAGPQQNQKRPLRRSADYVARAVVAMADSRRREVVLGLESKLMCLIDAVAPGAIDWVMARALTRRED